MSELPRVSDLLDDALVAVRCKACGHLFGIVQRDDHPAGNGRRCYRYRGIDYYAKKHHRDSYRLEPQVNAWFDEFSAWGLRGDIWLEPLHSDFFDVALAPAFRPKDLPIDSDLFAIPREFASVQAGCRCRGGTLLLDPFYEAATKAQLRGSMKTVLI